MSISFVLTTLSEGNKFNFHVLQPYHLYIIIMTFTQNLIKELNSSIDAQHTNLIRMPKARFLNEALNLLSENTLYMLPT